MHKTMHKSGDNTTEGTDQPAEGEWGDIPEVPDNPESPDDPDAPNDPETPNVPETPDNPDIPDNPDAPDPSTGILSTNTLESSKIVKRAYYTLCGSCIKAPCKEIYILREYFSNGKSRTRKVYNK